MADKRLDIPKVQQGRRRSFAGFQQQIQSANAAAAQFDAFASDMFADAAHDAKRKGVKAGRSAISLNSDGTVDRLPVPESGQLFMEAFEDQQRAAHLSATQLSFDSKTRDLMQSLERDKDRDSKFQDQFDAMANTFINSAPDDIKQDVRLKAELLGATGARGMARITAEEDFNENQAVAIANINALTERARVVARTMADHSSDEAIANEDIAPMAEAHKALNAAREAGFLTPEQYIEQQDKLTAILIEGRLHKEFAGINRNSLELTKRLQQFVDNPKSILGREVPSSMRGEIAKSIIQEITARSRAINAERAEVERAQKSATTQLETWIVAQERAGTIITQQQIRDQADKLGIDRSRPESRLAVEKLLGTNTDELRSRVINEALEEVGVTGVFSRDLYKKLIETAGADVPLRNKVVAAYGKHIKDRKTAADKTNETIAKGELNIKIDKGELKANDIRGLWAAIRFELVHGRKKTDIPAIDGSGTPPRTEKDLNPVEKYIFNNRDALITRADKVAEASSGMTTGDRKNWEDITRQGFRVRNQSQADLLGRKEGVSFDDWQVASDFFRKHTYIPKVVTQGFLRMGGMNSPAAVYRASRIFRASGTTILPDFYNTPAIVATMDYVGAYQTTSGAIDDMSQEDQEKTLTEVGKLIESVKKRPSDQENAQLATDIENATEDLKAHLEANLGYLHQKITGHSKIAGEQNWAEQLALNESGVDAFNTVLGRGAVVQGNPMSMLTTIYRTELRMNPGRRKEISMNKAIHRLMSRHAYGWSAFGRGSDAMKSAGHTGQMMYAPEKLQGKIKPTDEEMNDPRSLALLPTIGQMIQMYSNVARELIVRDVMEKHELSFETYGSSVDVAHGDERFFMEAVPSLSNPNEATYRVSLRDKEGKWTQFGDINAHTRLDAEFGRRLLNEANLRQNMFLGGFAPRLTGKLSSWSSYQFSAIKDQMANGEGPFAPYMWLARYPGFVGRLADEGAAIWDWATSDELPDPEIADQPSKSVALPPKQEKPVPLPPKQEDPVPLPPKREELVSLPPKKEKPASSTLSDQDRKVFQRIESSGRADAVQGSSIGLYQFQLKTAQELMPGVKKEDLLKPAIQEELLDRYAAKNAKQLGTTDPYELYMAHQQGVRGYKELLKIRDVRIKDIRDSRRKRKVMANRLPLTKGNKNATVGDFLDEWKSHYSKLKQEV